MKTVKLPEQFKPVSAKFIKEKSDWLLTKTDIKERRILLRRFKAAFPSLRLALEFYGPSIFIEDIKQDAGDIAVVIWLALAGELDLNDIGDDNVKQADARVSALFEPLKKYPEKVIEFIRSHEEPHLANYVYKAVKKKFSAVDENVVFAMLETLCGVMEVLLEAKKNYYYRHRPISFPDQPLQYLRNSENVCRFECILSLLNAKVYSSLADIVQAEKQLFGNDGRLFNEKAAEKDIIILRKRFGLPVGKDRIMKGTACAIQSLAEYQIAIANHHACRCQAIRNPKVPDRPNGGVCMSPFVYGTNIPRTTVSRTNHDCDDRKTSGIRKSAHKQKVKLKYIFYSSFTK